MLLPVFLAFLASASASGPVDSECIQKKGLRVYNLSPDVPVAVNGSCEETGLRWIGKPEDSPKDLFFTDWTEFFLQPECVDSIKVYIEESDDSGRRLIETRESLNATNLEGQNPVLTTDQSEELICNVGNRFKSRIVIRSKGTHPCFEITQEINPVAHKNDLLTLSDHFLNNKGPVTVDTEDGTGVNIFWRKGMMDKCVQAIEWTVDGSMNRTMKNTTKDKNEDRIFIKGQCKAQSVTFTYIFNTSIFQIEDKSLGMEIKGFTEVCAREKEEQEKAEQEEGEEGSEAYVNKDGEIQIMVGSAAGGFVLLIFVTIIVAIVKMRSNVKKAEDLQEN